QAPTPTLKIPPRNAKKANTIPTMPMRKGKHQHLKHTPSPFLPPTNTLSATCRLFKPNHQHYEKPHKKAKKPILHSCPHRAYTYAMPCILLPSASPKKTHYPHPP
ncbi:hypothetical protein COCCADRAFT_102291, partial [Bipolaris zeicola 26-R-13]